MRSAASSLSPVRTLARVGPLVSPQVAPEGEGPRTGRAPHHLEEQDGRASFRYNTYDTDEANLTYLLNHREIVV